MKPGTLLAATLSSVLVSGLLVAADLEVTVKDARGDAVAGAVVLAVALDRDVPGAPAAATAVIDQVDEEFVPAVSVVRTGTAISFPNRDNIRHHVYSFSPAKTFELPLYKKTPTDPILFDKPGIVTLGCNIHDWMLAYVHIVDTPYFALTSEDGTAVIENLPRGEYRVELQHPRSKTTPAPRTVTVDEKRPEPLAFEVRLKPEFRRLRAPRGQDGVYD